MIRIPGINLDAAPDSTCQLHGKLLEAIESGAVENWIHELPDKHDILRD